MLLKSSGSNSVGRSKKDFDGVFETGLCEYLVLDVALGVDMDKVENRLEGFEGSMGDGEGDVLMTVGRS
jgi:hypothetical protein